MCDLISRHLASSCKELAICSLIFRYYSDEVVVTSNSFISFKKFIEFKHRTP